MAKGKQVSDCVTFINQLEMKKLPQMSKIKSKRSKRRAKYAELD